MFGKYFILFYITYTPPHPLPTVDKHLRQYLTPSSSRLSSSVFLSFPRSVKFTTSVCVCTLCGIVYYDIPLSLPPLLPSSTQGKKQKCDRVSFQAAACSAKTCTPPPVSEVASRCSGERMAPLSQRSSKMRARNRASPPFLRRSNAMCARVTDCK